MNGYHGKYLSIDLAGGTMRREPIAVEVLRACIGGVGLGTLALPFPSISPETVLGNHKSAAR